MGDMCDAHMVGKENCRCEQIGHKGGLACFEFVFVLEKKQLLGPLNSDIMDYCKEVMSPKVTVGDIIDDLKTNSRLSFYLRT